MVKQIIKLEIKKENYIPGSNSLMFLVPELTDLITRIRIMHTRSFNLELYIGSNVFSFMLSAGNDIFMSQANSGDAQAFIIVPENLYEHVRVRVDSYNRIAYNLKCLFKDEGSTEMCEHIQRAFLRGRSIAILGKSGSGRHTISRLLQKSILDGSDCIIADNIGDINDTILAKMYLAAGKQVIGVGYAESLADFNLRISHDIACEMQEPEKYDLSFGYGLVIERLYSDKYVISKVVECFKKDVTVYEEHVLFMYDAEKNCYCSVS